MAAFSNNIVTTIATATAAQTDSSATPPPPMSLCLSPTVAPIRPISVSWNPHSALRRSHRSSLLDLYGLPGPLRPLPTPHIRPPPTITANPRLPTATLAYLTNHGFLRTVSLAALTRGRKAVILAVPGAFVPRGRMLAEELVRRAAEMRGKGGEVEVAIVAVNDVYVMQAWGEGMGAKEAGVKMLSDTDAELATAMGMAVDRRGGAEGFGVRSEGYCMVVVDGVVRAMFFNNRQGDAGAGASAGLDHVIKVL